MGKAQRCLQKLLEYEIHGTAQACAVAQIVTEHRNWPYGIHLQTTSAKKELGVASYEITLAATFIVKQLH